jgi:hypothetical protein
LSNNPVQGRGDARETTIPALTRKVTQLPGLDTFMQRVFEQSSPDGSALDEVGAQTLLRRDYETAFNLLQRASEAFPVLMRQCQRLEGEVRQIRVQAKADITAANGVTEQWHQLAMALKDKLDESERELAATRQRLSVAEMQMASDRRQADDAEHQASIAIGITTLFHDKIVEAFGVGSQAHSALDLVARGEVERRTPPTP